MAQWWKPFYSICSIVFGWYKLGVGCYTVSMGKIFKIALNHFISAPNPQSVAAATCQVAIVNKNLFLMACLFKWKFNKKYLYNLMCLSLSSSRCKGRSPGNRKRPGCWIASSSSWPKWASLWVQLWSCRSCWPLGWCTPRPKSPYGNPSTLSAFQEIFSATWAPPTATQMGLE